MSRIDVVIPCYNYARYLERCVASVLDQPGVDVRALVIDDCSTDDSEQVGRRLAAADPRIEYRRHASNHGHIATYNEGLLGWVTGDYCLLISADDLVTPGALTRAAEVLDRHPHVGLCHGKQIAFVDAIPDVLPPDRYTTKLIAGAEYWNQSCGTGQNLVATPTAVVRTSIQQAAGGYRSELPHTGDLDMWLRVAARADIVELDAVQALKRMHGANMQVQYVTRAVADLKQRHEAFQSAFADCGRRLADVPRLQAVVARALAIEAVWAASGAFEAGDADLCRDYLNAAQAIDPGVGETTDWKRFALKQRLGPSVWKAIRPLAQMMRRAAS